MSPPFDLNLSFQGIAANDSDSDSESIRNEDLIKYPFQDSET